MQISTLQMRAQCYKQLYYISYSGTSVKGNYQQVTNKKTKDDFDCAVRCKTKYVKT